MIELLVVIAIIAVLAALLAFALLPYWLEPPTAASNWSG